MTMLHQVHENPSAIKYLSVLKNKVHIKDVCRYRKWCKVTTVKESMEHNRYKHRVTDGTIQIRLNSNLQKV